jgi:hypothetical protein
MVLKKTIKGLFKLLRRLEVWSTDPPKKVYSAVPPNALAKAAEIHSVWDYLQIRENTQAFHLSGIVGFEERVGMEEIRRRIKEVFGVEYKNERSLYPYLKTLGDIGLVESTDAGGKRQWRKKDIIIKKEKQESPAKEEIEARNRAAKKHLD